MGRLSGFSIVTLRDVCDISATGSTVRGRGAMKFGAMSGPVEKSRYLVTPETWRKVRFAPFFEKLESTSMTSLRRVESGVRMEQNPAPTLRREGASAEQRIRAHVVEIDQFGAWGAAGEFLADRSDVDPAGKAGQPVVVMAQDHAPRA